MFTFYKIAESVAHGDMTHCKLHLVDAVTKDIITTNVKLKLGTLLEDENNNLFRVNGYFGDYMILRPTKHHIHPTGDYLISKAK